MNQAWMPGGELVERVLRLSRADEAIVIVTDTSEAALRWAGDSMTSNGVSTARSWSVLSVFRDGPRRARVGSVQSSTVTVEGLEQVVRASEQAARVVEPAPDAMPLPDAGPEPADWREDAAATDIAVFEPVARDLAAGFDGSDTLYGFAHHQVQTVWLGTSTGLRKRAVQPTGSVELNAKRSFAHHTGSSWVGVPTRTFTDVDLPGMLAELSRRLAWSERRVSLPAGRYETLLPPSTVADLLVYMTWSMAGRSAQEGHTAFAAPGGTRIGQRVGELDLMVFSDPHAANLQCVPFVTTTASNDAVSVFDNGLDLRRVDWVRGGIINALAYPRAWAAEYHTEPVLAVENLLLTGGSDITMDEMIAQTERALLLTTLWYIREVDPTNLLLTGLTRDGVYLVENGAITAEVNNFRFNESPLDMLRRCHEAGRTEPTLPREWKDWFTRAAMPPLRVADFHMSSVSRAT